ncbi:hypothetical protein BRD17_02995 [Halobacteriales archaeon SW_7_68_16]|nr:MAG: hypothetical protein BRD17_02995 [Halobacteriales archaeon SW_7_68_16]
MTLRVLVPSSVVREAEDKREATRKLGYVARAATVFRADELVVFPDPSGERGRGESFVTTVLEYATTPDYLRKGAFDVRDELEFVGVLPPLRASWQTGSESTDSGSLRQGLVTDVGPDGRVRVTCGLQHPISLVVPAELAVDEGERVPIRVSSRRPVRAKLVDEPLPGLVVRRSDLETVLGRTSGVTIAASRYGQALTVAGLGNLAATLDDGATVVFGAPERGLPAITGDEPGGDRDRFDRWVNAVPNQGSDVVRTEEAMFAVLACLNLR